MGGQLITPKIHIENPRRINTTIPCIAEGDRGLAVVWAEMDLKGTSHVADIKNALFCGIHRSLAACAPRTGAARASGGHRRAAAAGVKRK